VTVFGLIFMYVVPAIRSHADGRQNMVSTQDFNILTRKDA